MFVDKQFLSVECCNAAILHIPSGYPQILLLRQTLDLGTKFNIAFDCGLARGNLQFQGIAGLSIKSKISRFNFLVDLKEQSTQGEKNRWVGFPKIIEFKK